MERRELRSAAMDRAGGMCEWPGCGSRDWLQMAHISGIGMGGRPSADTLGNVAILCATHHDILDGRRHAGVRQAVGSLLAAYLQLHRGWAP